MNRRITCPTLMLSLIVAVAFSLFSTQSIATPDIEVPAHTYANYTISNNSKPMDGPLALTLVIGFFLIFWGMREGEYHWMMLAGFVWIFSSVTVLLGYGLGWMVIGLGIGLTVLAEGSVQLGRRKKE